MSTDYIRLHHGQIRTLDGIVHRPQKIRGLRGKHGRLLLFTHCYTYSEMMKRKRLGGENPRRSHNVKKSLGNLAFTLSIRLYTAVDK